MQSVVLAAGEGVRLRPFTESIPKVMVPIANRPILEYVIDSLVHNGVRDIIVVVGYKKESIMDYFQNGKEFNANIQYVIQDKQLGTGHALIQAKEYLKGRFLILPGDNIISRKTLENILDQKHASLLVTESDIPSKYGVVELEKDIIKNIVEKPIEIVGNLISTGIYILNKNILTSIEEHTSQGINELTSSVQHLIENGEEIQVLKNKGLWADAVYPWDLLSLNELVLHSQHSALGGTIEEDVNIKGKVYVGKNSVIRSGTYIVGPVVIGEGCEIGPHSCIFPSTSIGNSVSIGAFSEVRQSILMDDVRIGSHSSISHSILGKGCHIGKNVIQIVGKSFVKINGDFIPVDAIGSFIGDDSFIGSSTTISAGKLLGKSCTTSPMKTIVSNIESNSHVM